MPDWWEHGYPGGPMVPVPGFPRPLYPPDAAGYEWSEDGPDVIAYQRTVSRAGRWPWAPPFDDVYSNGFAHGKPGGNVGDSGIAGIQRQQKIEPPSGYIGKETFNTLRSIRIPTGLPHAGAMAMDATAANLIAEAWLIYHPPPSPPATVRERALAGATNWLGYTETPPSSNSTPFGVWYGLDLNPWCAMFATYAYEVEAGGSPSFERGSKYAYVPYIVADARDLRYGLSVTTVPIAGDLVCYDFSKDGTWDHVGLFQSWTGPTTFLAIEGNTSSDDDAGGSQSNGGGVYRRTRSVSGQGTIFIRVAEPS